MSLRQQIKKKIYKAKQENKDTSVLEEELRVLSLDNKVILQQKLGQINELYKAMEVEDFSPVIIDKIMPFTNKLDLEIRAIKEEIEPDIEWELPYFIKRIVKDKCYQYDRFLEIENYIKNLKPKNIEILENDKNTRYIVISIDGIKKRFNIMTKKEIIGKNYYWLSQKIDPYTYRKVKCNYTNLLKYIY